MLLQRGFRAFLGAVKEGDVIRVGSSPEEIRMEILGKKDVEWEDASFGHHSRASQWTVPWRILTFVEDVFASALELHGLTLAGPQSLNSNGEHLTYFDDFNFSTLPDYSEDGEARRNLDDLDCFQYTVIKLVPAAKGK